MPLSELASQVIACQQSVQRFYYGIDRGDFTLAMAQVTPDCLWERGGVLLCGPAEIEASVSSRPATQVARHIVNNFTVLRQEAESATAVFGLALHLYDDGSQPTLPVPGSIPFLLVDVTCELTLAPDNDWRIRKLDVQRTFSYASEVTTPLLQKPKQG